MQMSVRLRRFLEWYRTGGDILIFVSFWLIGALFLGQDRVIDRWSIPYLAAVLPAVMFPMLRLRQTLHSLLLGYAQPVAAFGLIGLAWLLITSDFNAIPPLFLITWVTGWACRQEISIDRRHLFSLALGFFAAGVTVYFISYAMIDRSSPEYAWMGFPPSDVVAADSVAPDQAAPLLPDQTRSGLDINPWGIFPNQTLAAFSSTWRVSVTPAMSTSALFSMLVLLIFLQKPTSQPTSLAASCGSTYFALLSFVRGVLTGLVLFASTYAMLRFMPRAMWSRLLVVGVTTIGLVIAVALFAPLILYNVQDSTLISRVFLRGQSGVTLSDIYRQMYRPWLWLQHVNEFVNSDYLMGAGSALKQSAAENLLNANHIRSDADSFLTRLLATYGMASFGMLYFLVRRAYAHSQTNDVWGLAMLSTLVWLMLTWGSAFHPSNGIYVLSFMILGLGSRAFRDRGLTEKMAD